MEKVSKFFKFIVLIILFSAALYFENAQQQRLFTLVVIFIIYLFCNLGKCFIKQKSKLYFISFIIDILLVYILEYNSRLLINYFFHSLYIIILLESVLSLDMKKGIIIGLFTVLVSMIKYVYLIYYKFNLSNVSQMAFFLMVNGLILIIACFAQYNKEEREKKEVLYKELVEAHRKLKEYNNEVNRLSVVDERNRIAREIHDSLGHNMTALIMQLQMAYFLINEKEDNEKAQSLLSDSVKTAKDSLSEIRVVVETLRGSDASKLAKENIKSLIDDFSKKTGADIRLTLSGNLDSRHSNINADLYRIIQECLTNAIRHGKASVIWVNIDYSDDAINFIVKDNGTGEKTVVEGYGIKGIRERVKAFNGKLEYEVADGFCIKGSLFGGEKW